MRFLPALLVLAVFVAPSTAAPREGTIKVDLAEVRCQPSDKPEFYVTNRLARGSKVEIIEEVAGGWLKIKPPPGSFSWIKTAFLEEITPNQPTKVVAIRDQEVPVMIGGEMRMTDAPKERPNIVGARLKYGEQVVPFANEVKASDGVWMRIQPPPSEVRYVKASALEAAASFSPAGGTAAAAPGGPLPAASTPSANLTMTPEQMWAEAVRQEQARRYEEAIRLWDGIAEKTARTHPQASATAAQRAGYLRGFLVNRSRSGFVQGQATSTFQRADAAPRSASYRGRIVATRGIGVPAYSLEVINSYGMYQHAFYVTGAGVNLAPFAQAGMMVEVWGTREQRNMAEHLTVTRIASVGGG